MFLCKLTSEAKELVASHIVARRIFSQEHLEIKSETVTVPRTNILVYKHTFTDTHTHTHGSSTHSCRLL